MKPQITDIARSIEVSFAILLLLMQVITDNAPVCKAAGKLIEEAYAHITWSPCVAHVCDLALEAIFQLPYFKEVHASTKGYVTFINNHHHTLAAWRQHSGRDVDAGALTPQQAQEAIAAANQQLQLLKPGETRFASALLMLEHLEVQDQAAAVCRV